jgi:manganese oxidase
MGDYVTFLEKLQQLCCLLTNDISDCKERIYTSNKLRRVIKEKIANALKTQTETSHEQQHEDLEACKDQIISELLLDADAKDMKIAIKDINVAFSKFIYDRADRRTNMMFVDNDLPGGKSVEDSNLQQESVRGPDGIMGFSDEVVAKNNVLQVPELESALKALAEVPGRVGWIDHGGALHPFGPSLSSFDIPTGRTKHLSPLYGAEPWTQTLLRFEEFGEVKQSAIDNAVPQGGTVISPLVHLPEEPNDADTTKPAVPFLTAAQNNIGYKEGKTANNLNDNPWATKIGAFLNRTSGTDKFTGVAEGRGQGSYGEHTRWEEMPTDSVVVTAMAEANINNGFRDNKQMHNYSKGEFAPGGLYHTVYASTGPSIVGTTAGIGVKFHPNFPVQERNSLWTYDGTFPPKLLMARYGKPVTLRIWNLLPISPCANQGFGIHNVTLHEHNGHTEAISDGYANSFSFPGEYYDYRYQMIVDGHDTIAVDDECHDKRCATIDDEGRPVKIPGDWREIMSTHWAHDHTLDFTSQNVYKGNAIMMNYYSAMDNGNESPNQPNKLSFRFPSGTALPWGNRDYDINLVIMDKAWTPAEKDANGNDIPNTGGQLWMNVFQKDGFLGDRMLVNWIWMPYFEVRARRYRFRILNGSVSRFLKYVLVKQVTVGKHGDAAVSAAEFKGEDATTGYDRIPLHMIANDGNLLEHALAFDGTRRTTKGTTPMHAIAERYDIIIDFAKHGILPQDKLYFVNIASHVTGKRPEPQDVSLQTILDGTYEKRIVEGNMCGDPCIGKFMEFRVRPLDPLINGGIDCSSDPSDYEPGKKQLIPIDRISEYEIKNAIHRNFRFVETLGEHLPWQIVTDNGDEAHVMNPARISAAPIKGALELWTLQNGGTTWSHNIHIHFTEGKVLLRDGLPPPPWEQLARKDVYRIGSHGDSGQNMTIALRFRDEIGTYMMHCHNTVHEDGAMLLRWDIREESACKDMSCPYPTWDKVNYVESFFLPSYKTGIKDSSRRSANENVIIDLTEGNKNPDILVKQGTIC